jgi:hypothetical protein
MSDFKRKLFLALISTVVYTAAFNQPAAAYLKALKYIKHQNTDKNMVVSDTIIHLPFSNFDREISKIWNKNTNAVMNLLDSVDNAQEHQTFVLDKFKNLKITGKEPTQIVYFSNFYSFMVIGEIMQLKDRWGRLSHRSQASFNQSTQYLFVFDEKYKLKKVFEIKIAYD